MTCDEYEIDGLSWVLEVFFVPSKAPKRYDFTASRWSRSSTDFGTSTSRLSPGQNVVEATVRSKWALGSY